MAVDLKLKAKEQGTYIVHFDFKDENGSPATPTAIRWTLADRNGTPVNARQDIMITTGLSSSMDLVLHDLDLKVLSSGVTRILTVVATYDSSLGMGLSIVEQASFEVEDLTSVSNAMS